MGPDIFTTCFVTSVGIKVESLLFPGGCCLFVYLFIVLREGLILQTRLVWTCSVHAYAF